MSLPTLLKVQTLQAALHAKAKGSPSGKFYTLYDKVYRADVLEEAYERCRKNGGAAGVEAGARSSPGSCSGLQKAVDVEAIAEAVGLAREALVTRPLPTRMTGS